ncbi:RNA-directed DNA polymerase [Vibrio campbellii CAIM 519 = NBRC 15631 = ATCC 25920]|nr:RNA-directed DNA polymerase [Vibrio campbellii CAIM 519 = NBRC 15631 = ATCC 25920]
MISSHEVSAPSGSTQWQSIDWKAVEHHDPPQQFWTLS